MHIYMYISIYIYIYIYTYIKDFPELSKAVDPSDLLLIFISTCPDAILAAATRAVPAVGDALVS